MDFWRTTRWPKDLHNGFYAQLDAEDPRGDFTPQWWTGFLPHLTSWKAIRPASPRAVTARVLDSLPELREAWATSCDGISGNDITAVHWKTVEEFVAVVRTLKQRRLRPEPVRSPVFTAKFCHFLLPAVFPVVDGKAMGLPSGADYRAHYEAVRHEWESTSESVQQDLRTALVEQVGSRLTPTFPVTNKVVEICLIGRRH
jgi:hypothetical protein